MMSLLVSWNAKGKPGYVLKHYCVDNGKFKVKFTTF
jgi:hypothetical protein